MPDVNLKVVACVLVLLAGSGYIWQFGFPISFSSYSAAEIPEQLKLARDEYKAKAASFTQADWNAFANGRRAEFKSMYETVVASNSTSAVSPSTVLALKQAMTFVAADFSLTDYRKEQFEKYDKLVTEMKP